MYMGNPVLSMQILNNSKLKMEKNGLAAGGESPGRMYTYWLSVSNYEEYIPTRHI